MKKCWKLFCFVFCFFYLKTLKKIEWWKTNKLKRIKNLQTSVPNPPKNLSTPRGICFPYFLNTRLCYRLFCNYSLYHIYIYVCYTLTLSRLWRDYLIWWGIWYFYFRMFLLIIEAINQLSTYTISSCFHMTPKPSISWFLRNVLWAGPWNVRRGIRSQRLRPYSTGLKIVLTTRYDRPGKCHFPVWA